MESISCANTGVIVSQEARYPRRISAQEGLAALCVVQRCQKFGALEHQVSRMLNLADAPVTGLTKHIEHRAQLLRVLVQAFMLHIGAQALSQLLGALHVVNAQETVRLSACTKSMHSRLSDCASALWPLQ